MNPSAGGLPAVIRRLSEAAAVPVSDADLLRLFRERHDEAAFEALVARHGPMVLDVCRGVLDGWADVEDAFQATFLVLARRAAAVRDPEVLGRWLYGVAARTARKARARAARRRRREAAVPPPAPVEPADLCWGEVQVIVRDELSRVAERFRVPLELCYLSGRTQDEAAALLGMSKGTLRRRLERGRALLRERLLRRGLGPVAALLAAVWPAARASAAVPALLAKATTAGAVRFALGGPASAAVSPAVASLTRGVLTAMYFTKLKAAAATTAFLVALLAAGAWGLTLRAGEEPPKPTTPPVSAAADPDAPKDTPVVKPEPPPRKAVRFSAGTTVGTIAGSPDGTLLAVGNDRPTMVVMRDGPSKVAEGWEPTVEILDGKTGKTVATLKLLTKAEAAVLPDTNRSPVFEVKALAFSPDSAVVAVGTTLGQVKLFEARTGKLVRALDDVEGKKKDVPTAEKFAVLPRQGNCTQLSTIS